LQKMEDDDTANPAMLFVQAGEGLWKEKAGAANKACADCHTVDSMKGAAARYPAIPPGAERPVDLEGPINLCPARYQPAEAPRTSAPGPRRAGGRALRAPGPFVALRSRGLPTAPPDDPRLAPLVAEGEAIWRRRQGQLNLSCATCHDDNAGKSLAGAAIPQG